MKSSDPRGAEPAPRLFGLLVTYRRHEALATHLDALAKQTRQIDHLLVVDNGPSGVEHGLVLDHPEAAVELDYLAMPDNLGPAGAISRGLEHLSNIARPDDWVVLLDDDDPPWRDEMLEQLVDFAQAQLADHPRLAMVGRMGARFDFASGRVVRVRDDELTGAVPVDYIAGGQLAFIRAGVARDFGGTTEDLFFGFDDLDFGLRLRRAGFDLLVHGDMALSARTDAGRLGDGVGAPNATSMEVPWRRYYSLRNLVYILRDHGASAGALRVMGLGLLKAVVVLVRRHDRESATYARLTLAALRDGWAGRLGRRVEPVPKA